MEFRSAALVGAGAIGGFFIKGLSEALGSSFCVVASRERADRLRKNGLVINGEQVYFNVCSPQEAAGADLILVATKYNSLPGILEDVRYMTGPGTTVVSTLNGVDSEEILAEVIGQEHILNAFMIVASRRVGNKVDYNLDAILTANMSALFMTGCRMKSYAWQLPTGSMFIAMKTTPAA